MTNPLGLSAEAKERRRNFVTASDAKRIMEGDWPALYREKKGLAEAENLDDKLAVQMGSFTEPFGLWWYEKQTGRTVNYYSDSPIAVACWKHLTGRDAFAEWIASREYHHMGCSLDATSTTSRGFPCVLDQKHVGTFRYDELVERYTAAGTHQAIVCNVDWWCLSVFVGNGKWELVEQEIDPFYREDLIEREREFWSSVERGEEPPDMRIVEPVKPQPRLRNLDLSAMPVGSDAWQGAVKRNQWLPDLYNHAETFIGTEKAAKLNAIARKDIGALLPEDIGALALPNHLVAKRNAAGSITLKVEKTDA